MELINTVLAVLVKFIEHIITVMGPFGISLLMAIESCNIPLPSEAILPFAGYIVSKGEMNFHVAAWAGAFGCVLGSIPSYYLGYFGGRKFIEKYGKYFLISHKDLDDADKWVEKYGDWAFFICRMLPVIRTFISLPAGILRARKRIFFTQPAFNNTSHNAITVLVFPEPVAITNNAFLLFFSSKLLQTALIAAS